VEFEAKPQKGFFPRTQKSKLNAAEEPTLVSHRLNDRAAASSKKPADPKHQPTVDPGQGERDTHAAVNITAHRKVAGETLEELTGILPHGSKGVEGEGDERKTKQGTIRDVLFLVFFTDSYRWR
jgi:hypothetical protein